MTHAVGVLNGNFRNGDYYQYVLDIQEAEQREAADLAEQKRKSMLRDITQEIRDCFETQAEYDLWWKNAPEVGFYEYAEDYLIQIKTAHKTDETAGEYSTETDLVTLALHLANLYDALRNEPMNRTAEIAVVAEIMETENTLQARGYVEKLTIDEIDPTGEGWFDFDAIDEIPFE